MVDKVPQKKLPEKKKPSEGLEGASFPLPLPPTEEPEPETGKTEDADTGNEEEQIIILTPPKGLIPPKKPTVTEEEKKKETEIKQTAPPRVTGEKPKVVREITYDNAVTQGAAQVKECHIFQKLMDYRFTPSNKKRVRAKYRETCEECGQGTLCFHFLSVASTPFAGKGSLKLKPKFDTIIVLYNNIIEAHIQQRKNLKMLKEQAKYLIKQEHWDELMEDF